MKISGADPDYHRRDLWEAIESGAYPEYELGLQIFSEEQAESFSFDVLDATKIVPEELVPLMPVGKLVLNRNPDNFSAVCCGGRLRLIALIEHAAVIGVGLRREVMLTSLPSNPSYRLHS